MKQRMTYLADGRVLSLVVEQDRGVIFNVMMADDLQILNVIKESLTLTSQALASWSTIRAEEQISDLQTWARKFMDIVQALDYVFSARCFNMFKSANIICNGAGVAETPLVASVVDAQRKCGSLLDAGNVNDRGYPELLVTIENFAVMVLEKTGADICNFFEGA